MPIKLQWQRIEKCAKAIRDKHGEFSMRTGRASGKYFMPCPACGVGVLHYTIAGNGHVHASCTNREGCGVLWRE